MSSKNSSRENLKIFKLVLDQWELTMFNKGEEIILENTIQYMADKPTAYALKKDDDVKALYKHIVSPFFNYENKIIVTCLEDVAIWEHKVINKEDIEFIQNIDLANSEDISVAIGKLKKLFHAINIHPLLAQLIPQTEQDKLKRHIEKLLGKEAIVNEKYISFLKSR